MELKLVSPTAKAPSQNFTGDVYINLVRTPDGPSRLIIGYVRFTLYVNREGHACAQQ